MQWWAEGGKGRGWSAVLGNLVDNIFLLQVSDFLFGTLKEIVDKYEGKIWEDFFTKHFERVSACMSKLLQSYYAAL